MAVLMTSEQAQRKQTEQRLDKKWPKLWKRPLCERVCIVNVGEQRLVRKNGKLC